MPGVTIEVTLPESLLFYGLDQQRIQREVEKWLVLTLFREGKVSSGKALYRVQYGAARLLGISRRDFLELLDAEGMAYLDYSTQELEAEFLAVRELTPNWSES